VVPAARNFPAPLRAKMKKKKTGGYDDMFKMGASEVPDAAKFQS
jgi:hypothetical protein